MLSMILNHVNWRCWEPLSPDPCLLGKWHFGWLIKRIQETWLLTVCCQQASLAWQRDRLFKTELSLQLRSVEAITDIACVLPSGSGPSGIQVHSPFALWGRSDPCSLLNTGYQDSVSARPLPPRWQQVCPTAATQFSGRDRCKDKAHDFSPRRIPSLREETSQGGNPTHSGKC